MKKKKKTHHPSCFSRIARQSWVPLHSLQTKNRYSLGMMSSTKTEQKQFRSVVTKWHSLGVLLPPHWLPIQAHIKYKLSTLCHSFFSDTATVYLFDRLCVYSPSRQLHFSSDSRTQCIPHIKTKTIGDPSFSHATPSIWSSLPREIRHIQSTTALKTVLKSHLFKSYLS